MTSQAGELVSIGRTGLSAPRLGFGATVLGGMPETHGYEVDVARGRAALDAILDGPVKFLDTSRIYGISLGFGPGSRARASAAPRSVAVEGGQGLEVSLR